VDGDLRRGRDARDLLRAADVVVGAGAVAVRLTATVARPFVSTAAAVLRLGARTPAARRVGELGAHGAGIRVALERSAAEAFRRLLPRALESALAAVDVTELVRAHVDLDALAEGIDVDAVVARADIETVIDRLDLDGVVARVDLDRAASRLDLEAVVDRIDLDAIVARVDLDVVASRIDLDAIVKRVDADAVVARVDLDAVLARLDLAGITRQVLEAIDFPQLMRESTGAASSQAARVVRTESMHADDAVARWVDRVLHRPHPGGPVPP
jgi:hypothetical protein